MPTANQITQDVIHDLMELEIIKLLHPETREPLTIDSVPAQNVIGHVAKGCTEAIKGINAHRPLEEAPQLMAPFPGMDEPIPQEKIDELNAILDEYERVGNV